MADEQQKTPLDDLSGKQLPFVLAYVSNGFNGFKAAREAHYEGNNATLRSIASENLTKPNIRAAIKHLMEGAAMSAEEVLARLAQQARGTMEDFLVTGEEEVTIEHIRTVSGDVVEETTETAIRQVARLDLMQAAELGQLGVIKKYTLDDKGKVGIELYSSQEALKLIGTQLGLFGAKGTEDDPIHSVQRSIDEWMSRQADVDQRVREAEQTLSLLEDDDDDANPAGETEDPEGALPR